MPGRVPHRKDIKYLESVEGNLKFVFEDQSRLAPARIAVETSNKKGYEVLYDWDDKKAMEIVAEHLGLKVGQEDREVIAAVIRVGKDGHHLKQVKKPETPQWHAAESDGVWPLHGVTMDELALFLESRSPHQAVVNNTGLAGYYWLDVPDTIVRGPLKLGETEIIWP